MKKYSESLYKASPFLFLLIGAQTLSQHNIGWVFGGILWFFTSRYYLIPRRIQRLSGKSIPSLIGKHYGTSIHALVTGIYLTYFLLFLVQMIQQCFSIFYIDLTLEKCLWMLLLACSFILLCAFISNIYFFTGVATTLVMTSSISLSLLFFAYRLDHPILSSMKFINIYKFVFHNTDTNSLIIAVLVGHPLFTHGLLENTNKQSMIHLFGLAGISLACFACINSTTTHLLEGNEISAPWNMILFFYYIATFFLSASLVLYMIANYLFHDVLALLSDNNHSRRIYYGAAFAVLISIILAYTLPPHWISKAHAFSLVPMSIAQLLFILILIGLYPSGTNFYAALLTSSIGYILLNLLNWHTLETFAFSIAVCLSGSVLLIVHYIQNEGFNLPKHSWWEKQEIEELGMNIADIKNALFKIILFPLNIATYARQSIARQGINHESLNLYITLTAFLGIHLWPLQSDTPYISIALNIFILNLIAALISLLLPVWPKLLAPYFALYWHLWLGFYLIVTPTLIAIFASSNTLSLINLVLSTILIAKIVSRLSFLVTYLLAILSSIILTKQLTPHTFSVLMTDTFSLNHLIYTHILAFFTSFLFLCKSEEEINEPKQKLRSLVKKSIAIVSNSLNITQSHASIIELCTQSMDVTEELDKEGKDQKVLISMDQSSYTTMKESLELLLDTIQAGRAQLKRIFLPINTKIKTNDFKQYQALPCVKEAIDIFMTDYDGAVLPNIQIKEDFTFKGSDIALIAVLVQLLKNAYEYSQSKGTISIHIKDRKIYVINDKSVISRKNLPHIFNEFYSTHTENLGLGLFFAREVMEAFGGTIHLHTTNATDKTCFILTFPKI